MFETGRNRGFGEFLGRKEYTLHMSNKIQALCGEIYEDMTRGVSDLSNLFWLYVYNAQV